MDKQNNPPEPASGLITRRELIKSGMIGACALCMTALGGVYGKSHASSAKKGFMRPTQSPWFSPLSNAAIQCELCPKQCHVPPGKRGTCRVRENRDGQGYTLAWGNPALVQMDPVERIPFFHVLPGTRALSVSTAGCPLECKFCEVWDMALADPEEIHAYDLLPETIVSQAKSAGAQSISYAFGEPVAFYEYMNDIAGIAKAEGLLNLMHTSGYISPEPLQAIVEKLDAVNIDLKGFDPDFYREMVGGELQPVKNTMKMLKRANVHIEITNLVIPTLNDDIKQVKKMCEWIITELGADTPVHFGRFYPLYKLSNLPQTPVSTLDDVRDTAITAGLSYVYVARVTGHEGENTFCGECREKIIDRMGFIIEKMHIKDGKCGFCDAPIAGRWA